MTQEPFSTLVRSFFVDHLAVQRGLRPTSIRSYRDAIRLLLCFAARELRKKITRLSLGDFTMERVQKFLRHLEKDRGNHIRTRNQRLAALRTFFGYVAGRAPEFLPSCTAIAAIAMKRVAPPETTFLERPEVAELFRSVSTRGPLAERDRALLLFLYNTGARVQEVADLRIGQL